VTPAQRHRGEDQEVLAKRHALYQHARNQHPYRWSGATRNLVMFCLPLLSSFLEPYIDAVAPGLRPNNWVLQMLGDAMLIGSFFVLGGNFWEKLRALFIRTARVTSQDPA
jgi:hypothetical protein